MEFQTPREIKTIHTYNWITVSHSDLYNHDFGSFVLSLFLHTNARENSFPKKISVICRTNFLVK